MIVPRFKGSCVRSLAGEGYGNGSQAPREPREACWPRLSAAWMFQACSPSLLPRSETHHRKRELPRASDQCSLQRWRARVPLPVSASRSKKRRLKSKPGDGTAPKAARARSWGKSSGRPRSIARRNGCGLRADPPRATPATPTPPPTPSRRARSTLAPFAVRRVRRAAVRRRRSRGALARTGSAPSTRYAAGVPPGARAAREPSPRVPPQVIASIRWKKIIEEKREE